jgi:FkbH-like protein
MNYAKIIGSRVLSNVLTSQTVGSLRRAIDEAINHATPAEAVARMAELWRAEPGLATAGFLLPRYEGFRDRLSAQPYRLAILRSFTVEPLVPLLRTAGFAAGVDLSVYLSQFAAHAQEILDAGSPLYEFAPDAVILAVRTPDIAPELWDDPSLIGAAGIDVVCARVADQYRQWLTAFRSRSQAAMIVHGFEQPADLAAGVLDRIGSHGQSDAIARLNAELAAITREYRGVYFLDYDGLLARHGRLNWHDERRWLTVRLPIAGPHLLDLVRAWLRFLHPLTGRVAKALVVDLDNTLWGGVIGEDGLTGIRLGAEYPGAAFQHFQRVMLDLHRRGILLAICSKNNHDDAMEALQKHPGMIVRPEHFAAMRINWQDKAENLREIAAELNIGADALAFVDDNPVERELVRQRVPEVSVVDLPADPLQYAGILRDCPLFERLTLSAEDRQRGEMYASQQKRLALETSAGSREDFLRSLAQEAEIAPVSAATLARVAQLTQKTNQFNLTTRRYSEEEVSRMASRPDWTVQSISIRDRYGDNGLVGVAITADADRVCQVDTFLLSCRVIARSVETAFLSAIAEQAYARGCRALRGVYYPTRKNGPCKDFFAAHGFLEAGRDGEGTVWEFELSDGRTIPCPDWIRVLGAAARSR